MKAKTKRKQTRRRPRESSPVTMLESELHALHRDLRTVAKAYIARLENDLLVCLAALRSYGPIEQVSRETLHQIRDLTIIVRNRKLKPEKGRRKDLRKIDSLIVDLVSTIGQKN
jgi:hypothetical protein